MKKRNTYLLWILLTGLLWGAYYLFADPFERIQSSREGTMDYLDFYAGIMSEKDMEDLLLQCLTEEQHYHSLREVCWWIEKRGMCDFLPYMEARCSHYASLPQDTVLYFIYKRTYKSINIVPIDFKDGRIEICETTEALRKKCFHN